jgi:hypothetical protein
MTLLNDKYSVSDFYQLININIIELYRFIENQDVLLSSKDQFPGVLEEARLG